MCLLCLLWFRFYNLRHTLNTHVSASAIQSLFTRISIES